MTAPAPMARLPDWPERLDAYLSAQAARSFAWGRHDCVTFAAGAVQAITGIVPPIGQWPDAASAARLLRSLGGLAAAVDRILPRLQHPLRAARGDVVLVRQSGLAGRRAVRQWLAVVDAAGWRAPGPDGLVRGPITQISIAWAVGRGVSEVAHG